MGTYLVSPVQTACQRVYITLTGKQETSVYIIFDKKTALGSAMENRIINKCGFLSDGYVMHSCIIN